MNTTTRATISALAGLAALASGVFAPAVAGQAAFPDPADMGGASLNDIRRVTIDHGTDRLTVRIRFVDLRRESEGGPASLTALLNTRSALAGPEFRLTTGLYAGTDYQLRRVVDGRPVGEPLTCSHRLRLDFADDVLRFRAARSCLDLPSRVRVGVKMTDEYDGSHPVTDWLGEPRSFTPWVRSS
jgi:hypothetical protein